MDSKSWKLDFGMQILLTHALRSEAGLLRQHYPKAKSLLRGRGHELIQLKSNLQLLRTGVGLEASESVLNEHVDPNEIDMIIHFGVSGSLTTGLRVNDIVRGENFFRSDKQNIFIDPVGIFDDLHIPVTAFYSSSTPIVDENSREAAKSTGAGAVDMESYAVADFCRLWDIPLLSIRCISDSAGASTPEDFAVNYPYASELLQKFLLEYILSRLPGCS